MKRFPLFLLCFLCSILSFSQTTKYEKTNGKETSTYFEVIQFYKDLVKSSSKISIKEMGPTDAGYPLHLVMISDDKSFDPKRWHQEEKVVIFINNGIHPGEPDGIDASMMLVRDILQQKIKLPNNVALAFIPVYNIGGSLNRNSFTRVNQNGPKEYGFRGNSQNLDLNRDFTKSDSKEAKSFAAIFHYLNPDIFIDNHVSDGADYQHTMTLISTQYEKLGPVLGKWLKETFEPALYKSMAKKKWDLIPYVDFDATDFSKGMKMFYDPPRYSTGYAALFNTLSFMPETHMLKPYKDRVQSTYDLMVSFIDEASANAKTIKQKRKEASLQIQHQLVFPLKWTNDNSNFSEITFKGYERDSALSEATGLQKMFYNKKLPFTKQIKYYNSFKISDSVKKPLIYIIPAGWYSVIELLQNNGIKVSRLLSDSLINVTSYKIASYKSMPTAYEKHHKNYNVQINISTQLVKFLKGDFIIKTDQPHVRYLIEMLEPTGDDSFFAWNFFDGILQQKEGYSDYRWENLAAEVLNKDERLKLLLEEKKASDSNFASDSRAILAFIYKNSVYYEKTHLQYPVYRIESY